MTAWTIKHPVRLWDGSAWGQPVSSNAQNYMRTTMNEKVKKETGFGKYGLPQGTKDENPFRWIAWMRYANKESDKIWSELRSEIRKKYPNVRFMSEDSSGCLKPMDYSAGADMGICDFYTQQTVGKRSGHMVKCLADLTQSEVFPMMHLDHGGGRTYTPDQVREQMSIVFRAGGTGFSVYTSDYSPREINNRAMEFGAPERWQAILELGDRIRAQKKIRYPKPDVGVMYCNASYQARNPFLCPWSDAEVEFAYNVFGPDLMKTWFRFVDENIILNHFEDLAGFKALAINFGNYQLPGIMEKVEEFARTGGVVLCFDPEGFTWSADGTSLVDARKELFGVEVGESFRTKETFTFKDSSLGIAKGTTLPTMGKWYAIKALPGAKVIATFSNGQPAIVEKTVGKGRVFFFGSNPVVSGATRHAGWTAAFRGMGKALGIKLDRDIWRFTFPPFERDLYPEDPEGVCITDNYQRFENELPVAPNNHDSQGTYRISPAPDKAVDEGGTGDVAFNKGDLTDRRFAYALNKKPGPSANYVVIWEKNVPVEVVFDFKRPYPVKCVRVWYANRLPRFAVSVSKDGKSWQEVGRRDIEEWTDGVRLVERNFAPQNVRYLKLSFEKRDKREKYDKKERKNVPVPQLFNLVEVEVWADK